MECDDELTTRQVTVRVHLDAKATPVDLNEPAFSRPQLIPLSDTAAAITRLQRLITTDKTVSRSVIELKLRGPDVCNITLIDLPGIVRALAQGEQESLISEISEMMTCYIERPYTFILPIVPCINDFRNCEVLQKARAYDKETLRILPVLTKPDLVERGSERSIEKLLLNEATEEFVQGFHMLKCRSQSEMREGNKMSLTDAEKSESDFFERHLVWKAILADKPQLFGIQMLREKLSRLYMEECVAKQVPRIINDLQVRKEKLTADFKTLGVDLRTDAQRRAEFRRVKDVIQGRVQDFLKGSPLRPGRDEMTARAALEEAKNKFGQAVRQLPEVSPLGEGNAVRIFKNGEPTDCTIVKVYTSRAGVLSYVCLPTDGSLPAEFIMPVGTTSVDAPQVRSTKSIKLPHNCLESDGLLMEYSLAKPRHLKAWSEHELTTVGTTLAMLRKCRRSPMPIFEGENLFNSAVIQWIEGPVKFAVMAFAKEVTGIVQEYSANLLADLVQSGVINQSLPDLKAFTVKAFDAACATTMERLNNGVEKCLKPEHTPQTMNHYFTETLRKLRFQRLKLDVLSRSTDGQKTVSVPEIERAFDSVFRTDIDEFVAEGIDQVLSAYFKVASKRIIDNIASVPEQELDGKERSFHQDVVSIFNAASDKDEAVTLLKPSEGVQRRYDSLKRQLEEVTMALEKAPSLLV